MNDSVLLKLMNLFHRIVFSILLEMVHIENQPIRIIMIRTLVMIVRYNADYDQRKIPLFLPFITY